MRDRLAPLGILVAILAVTAATTLEPAAGSNTSAKDPAGLVAHEWGTFTSIAGADGAAVEWLPQAGPAELPCFVYRMRMLPKGFLTGTIRMETPVILFLLAQRNHRERQGAVPSGRGHRMVPRGADDARHHRAERVQSSRRRRHHRVAEGHGDAQGQGSVPDRDQADALLRRARDRRRATERWSRAREVSLLSRRGPFRAARQRDDRRGWADSREERCRPAARRSRALRKPRRDDHLQDSSSRKRPSDHRRTIRSRQPRHPLSGAREDSGDVRALPERSRRDGRHLARLVVRGRHAAALRRAEADRRVDPAARDHPGAGAGRARVRRAPGARHRADAAGSTRRHPSERCPGAQEVRPLLPADRRPSAR